MAFRRKKALWRVMGEEYTLGVKTLLTARIELGIGGFAAKVDAAAALDSATRMEESGADIIELNPGPRVLTAGLPVPDQELSRLVPVLRKLEPRLAVPISVVTANTETARKAIDLGASIIHDFTGLAFDVKLAPAVNETDAALVLGHMRGSPTQWPRMEPLNRLGEHVRTDLRASLLRAHKAGIEPRRIVFDPGLEHGKRGQENFNLLRSLGSLVLPGQGVQADLSGRRFLVESVRSSQAERIAAQAVAATLALESGAHALTVEDPQAIRDAVKVVDRIYHGDETERVPAPLHE